MTLSIAFACITAETHDATSLHEALMSLVAGTIRAKATLNIIRRHIVNWLMGVADFSGTALRCQMNSNPGHGTS